MKYKILVIALIASLLFLPSCKKDFVKESYYESGNIKEKFVFTSKQDFKTNLNYEGYRYYENGNVKNRTQIVNGKREGSYISYFPEGSIQRITKFRNNNEYGPDRFFSKSGEVIREDFYINGDMLLTSRTYNNDGGRAIFYYYIENDSLIEMGRMLYSEENEVINKGSFYYTIEAEDSIRIEEDYKLKITVYTFDDENKIIQALLGDFNRGFEFVDSSHVIELTVINNTIDYSFKPSHTGDNIIMGKLYIEAELINNGVIEKLEREFIFYKDFYVVSD